MSGNQENNPIFDSEGQQNIVVFFDLLLKIDRRINPKNYQSNEN